MTERPILMTPENAQKCFDGSKTQTRRIVKPQPEEGVKILGPEMFTPCRTDKNGEMYPGEDVFGVYSDDGEWGVACPYGVPGDRLWIREAWAKSLDPANDDNHPECVLYRGANDYAVKWKPSLHMPRWACRTVVEITEIRVQRVQEISESDAKVEGCEIPAVMHADAPQDAYLYAPKFKALWASINGAESWAQNPWVWAISFKKVTA